MYLQNVGGKRSIQKKGDPTSENGDFAMDFWHV